MGRLVRDARIETREARLRLKARHEPYWRLIHESLHLGYRKGPRGGVWLARTYADGRYRKKVLGKADDTQDASGQNVLSFRQAQQLVLEATKSGKQGPASPLPLLTVAEASDCYLAWFRKHRKSVAQTENALCAHILPVLGNELVAQLSSPRLRQWLEDLATRSARARTSRFGKTQKFRPAPKTADEKRARQATANRVLNVLKALLNKAFHDGLVSDDTPWRRVTPFENVDEARIRFLTDAEAVRLVKCCRPEFRYLVQAALLTGARYGELRALKVRDVNLRTAQVYISQSKSGKPRHIPLNPEGLEVFRDVVAKKTSDDLVFVKHDGQPWGKNHHVRPLAEACRGVQITPMIAFHELRHTYASHLAQASVDLLTISSLLGHSDTRTTSKHYAHLSDRTLAEAVTKLPSFGGAQKSKPRAGRIRRNAVRGPARLTGERTSS